MFGLLFGLFELGGIATKSFKDSVINDEKRASAKSVGAVTYTDRNGIIRCTENNHMVSYRTINGDDVIFDIEDYVVVKNLSEEKRELKEIQNKKLRELARQKNEYSYYDMDYKIRRVEDNLEIKIDRQTKFDIIEKVVDAYSSIPIDIIIKNDNINEYDVNNMYRKFVFNMEHHVLGLKCKDDKDFYIFENSPEQAEKDYICFINKFNLNKYINLDEILGYKNIKYTILCDGNFKCENPRYVFNFKTNESKLVLDMSDDDAYCYKVFVKYSDKVEVWQKYNFDIRTIKKQLCLLDIPVMRLRRATEVCIKIEKGDIRYGRYR